MLRTDREGRIFTSDPKKEGCYRLDGDISNERELVTPERLGRACGENQMLLSCRGLAPARHTAASTRSGA